MEKEIEKEIISKAGFPLYVDYWDKYFTKLTGDQVKEVMKIVFHFNKTFEVLSTNDLAVDMVTSTIIDNIKRDAQKRVKQSNASRENGKLGGRPKKETSNKDLKPKPKPKNKPTLQDVQDYCKERNNSVDAKKFFDYYSAGNWKDAKGNQVKNWKQKLLTWESKNQDQDTPKSNTNQRIVDFINKMIKDTLINRIIISSPNKAQIWFNDSDSFKKYQDLDIKIRNEVKEKITEELNITNFEPKF